MLTNWVGNLWHNLAVIELASDEHNLTKWTVLFLSEHCFRER